MKNSYLIFVSVLAHLSLAGQNVNQFTGSFDYTQPLFHLPSDRGNGVSIDASYNSGMQVNQPASEIGLGWNLNHEAAIYRTVSGFPDDLYNYSSSNMITGEAIRGQGALYPSNLSNGATNFDLARTSKGPSLDSVDFTLPAFDNFSVDGPAFGGKMKLSYTKFYAYQKTNVSGSATPNYQWAPYPPSGAPGYLKPQFHFSSDFADTLVSRHYPANITGSTPFKVPANTITDAAYPGGNAEPFYGKSGITTSSQNYNIGTGRLATSNFVEYFTNKEINDASANSFTNTADALTAATSSLIPFIDYKSIHGRSALTFPAEGIGYFRITASNGLTYHYSLPVYELETVNYSAPLDKDYSLPAYLSSSTFTYGLSNAGLANQPTEPYLIGVPNDVRIKTTNTNKFAVKWLLTAITGRDFVDVNNDHRVDDGDAGYWISYDYQLWSREFVTRSPKYGYDYQFSPDESSKHYPVYYPIVPGGTGNPVKLSGLFASVSISKSEVYFLSKIRTSSHTAVFVMDTRKDENSSYPSDYITAGFKPTPSLLIKRILLFNNTDLGSILASTPVTYNSANFSNTSSFDFSSNINTSSALFTETWFQSIISSNSGNILKNIEFDQDYSLCRNYHGNINVSCPGSSPLISPGSTQSSLAVSNYSASGKLTLKRILTYDFQNVKVTPSTVFDYKVNDVLSNPDFNPIKTDYWGFYKSDATNTGLSRYTNGLSKDYTKAWSLINITDPLGGITEIEYESNSYSKVLDVEKGTRGAAYIYRIKDVNTLHESFNLVMEEGSNASYPVTEFAGMCSSNLPGLKKIVCLPYCEPTNPSSGYPPSFAGLAFGPATLALNPGSITNTVTGTFVSATLGGARWVSANDLRKYNNDYIGNYNTPTIHAWSSGLASYDVAYSGGGFIMFEKPIGTEVFGCGIRVKSIKTRNSSSEIYKEEYTYSDGVATNEMDRFDYQAIKTGCGGSWPRYDYLRPKTCDMFEMSPSVGYSKVTVQDLGRINAARGKVETEYITDPAYNANQFSNSSITTFTSINFPQTYMHTLNECMNQFSSVFGAVSQTTVYDKNDNMISKTVNDYESTQQGALSENFYFYDPSFSPPVETVNILRDIPVILKSTTTYGAGTVKKTETLARDEYTGVGTTIRSSGINKSTSLSYKRPAYRYYHALESLDFNSAVSRKMLPLAEDYFTYSNVDTTLTAPQLNGYSASFLSANYKLYSRKVRQLLFSASTGTMSPADVILPYYINNRRFTFDGGQGSMNEYGLLKKSSLSSNTLNLAATTTVSIWEPGTAYNWKLINELTLIDEKKHVLEARDGNNNFVATKYCWNNYYANSTVSNCNYASFTFADFEGPVNATYSNGATRLDGDLLGTTYSFNSGAAHTGARSIGISSSPLKFVSASQKSPGTTLDIGLLPGRIYRVSVWTYTANASNAEVDITVSGLINGSTSHSAVYVVNTASNLVTTIGAWTLIQSDFELPEGFATGSSGQFKIELKSNSGTVYYDDFMFYPVESNFSASVYNGQNGRVSSTIDASGLATNYIYDAAGKTLEVWKEIPHTTSATGVYKKIKSNTYNYARGASN